MKKLEATLGWVIIISFVLSISAKASEVYLPTWEGVDSPPESTCSKNVQKLKTGTSSPCDGWLVSEPKMQELAKNADELELSRKLILAQTHLQKLSGEEIEFFRKRSSASEKALSQLESQRFWIGLGAFALGVVVTGFAAKAAIEATR